MEIRWDEQLTIDNGVIDDDHRIAIFIVNDFIHMKSHEACRERAIEIIDTLRRHMRHHFVREEAFQRSINFIDGAEHEREHAVLARRLDQITEKLEFAEPSHLPGLIRATTNLLKDWLVEHILGHDMAMKKFIDQNVAEVVEAEVCFV